MSNLILVPFDGAPASVEALRSACGTARLEGSAVVALYVARVPRQLPLSAGLPSLAKEAERLRLLSEEIGRGAYATVWPEWVWARDTARAVVDVAEELGVRQIVIGLEPSSRFFGFLAPWSAVARIITTAPCPVLLHSLPGAKTARPTVAPGLSR